MKGESIAIITLSVFLAVIVIVFVVWVIVVTLRVSFYERGICGAFENNNFCIASSVECAYIDYAPPMPIVFSPGFDIHVARYCGQMVWDLEHYGTTIGDHVPGGLQLLSLLYTVEVGVSPIGVIYFDSANQALYIAFRGTSTKYEWIKDETIAQISYSNTQTQNIICDQNSLIHSGFSEIFEQLQPTIQQTVASKLSDVDKIIVSGHSLGAALASLTSSYLYPTLNNIYTYTFAKPRVGNAAFADCMDIRFPDRFWRIENEEDLVPTLPPSVTPNWTVNNQPWLYSQEGKSVTFQDNRGSIINNHLMPCYMNYIVNHYS